MDFQYDRLLLQMLIVLIPIILYLATSSDRKGRTRENILWGVVCAFTLSLTIVVSIICDPGIRLDLRMVPWYLSFIYGGTGVGIFVTACFFIIRFLYAGVGMIPGFIAMTISLIGICWFQKNFHSWSQKKKIYRSILFVAFTSATLPIIAVLLITEPLNVGTTVYYVVFVVENGIMAWFSIYLMESHREKMALIKEVQRNEKMQVVGQLAASVAHEIRNPMTSVRGFLQLLTGSKNLSSAEKEYVFISLEELDRANYIISDYLSLGKNQIIQTMSPVDIGQEAIKSVNSLSSYATFHNVNVSKDVTEKAVILGNPGRLQQMFVNLIKNAIEAAQAKVEIKIVPNKSEVNIFISNDGEGMNTEQIEKLGLPFYSTKEKGTGLGLMVTLQIIKEMGGKWKVVSDEKTGTVFELTFPLSDRNE
ncbi:HAMP domain-containing sensor histidine kinase [Bacillus sp. V5-8f]|uniref:sensor histidine kinase n=1 Tax=Bacillus sp. V5-8f TaxID=2053044 RepID=UPI0015E0A0B9|nr:HAMP domain-containing sensor histidine kinase [Bacillus sp. V5-8f]